jgi:hypothetical protein
MPNFIEDLMCKCGHRESEHHYCGSGCQVEIDDENCCPCTDFILAEIKEVETK